MLRAPKSCVPKVRKLMLLISERVQSKFNNKNEIRLSSYISSLQILTIENYCVFINGRVLPIK